MDANSCTNEGQPGAPLTGSSAPIVQVSHWQARALQAEAELATLKARLAASQLRTPGTNEICARGPERCDNMYDFQWADCECKDCPITRPQG